MKNSVSIYKGVVRHLMATCLTALAVLSTASHVQAGEALPYYNSADFTPHWHKEGSPELADFHRIPSFSFTNQEGRKISEKEVEGKLYVASFFFSTCPGICPMLRSKLSIIQDEFIDDDSIVILSHSIRPSTDTVEVLQSYAKNNSVETGKWHLLTGDQATMYSLAREAYFANEDLGDPTSTSDFLHTENLLLIDQDRRIRGVYNGLNRSSVKNLISDIGRLKAATLSR